MLEFDWDDNDEEFIYDNVQWYWDENSNKLMCKSKTPDVNKNVPVAPGILGTLEFRHHIDLNEQQRFRNRFSRKYDDDDVVTLQDIKDVVLFTAPLKLMLPATIGMLHLPATDRLLRALIMYCQYFLQISDIIQSRKAELQFKIRTPNSDKIEAVYKENLAELRILISKEYSLFLTGSGKFSKYHHMWSSKTNRGPSLGKKEQTLFESFLLLVVQLIWIALGRKSFTQIEIEVHRLFKTATYNVAKHKQNIKNSESWKEMKPSDIFNTTVRCIVAKKKTNSKSPLINELLCVNNNIDHRLLGLGVYKYPCMDARLHYLENALIMPEASLSRNHISLGILGIRRNRFDIMLNEIPPPAISSNCVLRRSSRRLLSISSNAQSVAIKKTNPELYRKIHLPSKESISVAQHDPYLLQACRKKLRSNNYFKDLPFGISNVTIARKPIDSVQRSKWMRKVLRQEKSN